MQISIKWKKRLLIASGSVFILFALSLAGKWDSDMAQDIENDYCERVASGEHGHYNERIDCE
jgi:hypothetical protein